MLRHTAIASLAWLFLSGCGPSKPECSAPHADFNVIVKFANRPLPPDTVVHVTYGGSGMEDFSLAAPGNHEVVFCQVADAAGNPLDASALAQGAAGDGNSANESEAVEALFCALWTGGYSKAEVSGTGISTMTYDLSPQDHVCTVDAEILLDQPDAG